MRKYLITIILIVSVTVLAACGGDSGSQTQNGSGEAGALNEAEIYQPILNNIGEYQVNYELENKEDETNGNLPEIVKQQYFEGSEKYPLCSALYDIDSNGVKELVIGVQWDEVIPMAVYTVKDGKPFIFDELNSTEYLGIYNDGTVSVYLPDEQGGEEVLYKVDGSRLKKVNSSNEESANLKWDEITTSANVGMTLDRVKATGDVYAIKKGDRFYPLMSVETVLAGINGASSEDDHEVIYNYIAKNSQNPTTLESGDSLVVVNSMEYDDVLLEKVSSETKKIVPGILYSEYDYDEGALLSYEPFETPDMRLSIRSVNRRNVDELYDKGIVKDIEDNAYKISSEELANKMQSVSKDSNLIPIGSELDEYDGIEALKFLYLAEKDDVRIACESSYDSIDTEEFNYQKGEYKAYNVPDSIQPASSIVKPAQKVEYQETEEGYYIVDTDKLEPGIYATDDTKMFEKK